MPVLSFCEELLQVEADVRAAKLRPGLANPHQSLSAALRTVLAELSSDVSEKLRTGVAQCPRTGYLRPLPKKRPARVSKGQGNVQQQARSTSSPHVSKIIMMRDREELACSLPPASGKLSALWIARMDVVESWLRGGWRKGVKTLYELGVERVIVGVAPDARQTTVEPRILELPSRSDGLLAAVPHDDCPRVLTVLLSDFTKRVVCMKLFARNSAVLKSQCFQRHLPPGRRRRRLAWMSKCFVV